MTYETNGFSHPLISEAVVSESNLSPEELWKSLGSVPFDEWITALAAQVSESGLGIVRFARAIDVQPAEVLAVLKLASLDPEDLATLGNRTPPKTTWLSLADATSEELVACLEALASRPPGSSPFKIVSQHLGASTRTSKWAAVLEIPGSTLEHFWKKHQQWNVLGERSAKALKSFATRKKQGKPFTNPQAQFLTSILEQLVEAGVVSEKKSEKDFDLSAQVLRALNT